MMKMYSRLPIFILLTGLPCLVSGILQDVKEYCFTETFTASCADNEVIVMTSAVFGVIKIGRCVVRDLGHLGCQSEQLAYLDKMCSGRSECQLPVSDNNMQEDTPCTEGYMPYLEASYVCQKVMKVDHSDCFSHSTVRSSSNSISSISVQKAECGTAATPLVLQALPGQSINISLTDFNWGDSAVLNEECGRLYGHIISYDNNDIIDICGSGGKRDVLIHLSTFHQVQIALDESALQQAHFVVNYQVIGCGDIVPPKNAWIRKDKNQLTVGCLSDNQKWPMKCVGNHWIGVVGNCTEVALKDDIKTVEETVEFNSNHGKYYFICIDVSNAPVLAIGTGCLAIILCCITVTIGVYLIKRNKTKMTMEATYGKIKEQDNYLLPKGMNTQHTLRPDQNQSRASTVLVRATQDDNHPFNTATFRTQARPGVQSGSLGHHRQASVPFQSNEDYVNTATCLAQEDDSVKYFVLEKPPDYNGAQ